MRKLTRSQFLKLLLTSTAMTSLPLISCEQSQEVTANNGTSDQQLDVIIIGAGIAGITAGFELQKKGLNVLILEARDRIGGRIWTDQRWGIPLDLGAGWLHESEGNPLTKLTEDFAIETIAFDYDDMSSYDHDGRELSEVEGEEYEALFEEIMEKIETLRNKREQDDQDDISLQSAFDQVLSRYQLSQEDQRVITYFINTTIEHEYAGDVKDLSLYYWDQELGFAGEDLIFPQGYQQIIDPLAKGLNIKLNHQVEKIQWEPGIKITTNQGIFQSKYLVITLPLGVLKSGKVEFLPPLPEYKQRAINNLGMGVLNKVYLKFPEVFWDDNQMLEYISVNKGEWNEWVNIHKLINEPILLGFNAGLFGAKIESFSDQEIIKSALAVLKTIYQEIPDPVDTIITRWQQDPFASGSYSFVKTGATPQDFDDLAQNVKNKLFFAGEATSKGYSATVHGAYLSGKRVAQEIITNN